MGDTVVVIWKFQSDKYQQSKRRWKCKQIFFKLLEYSKQDKAKAESMHILVSINSSTKNLLNKNAFTRSMQDCVPRNPIYNSPKLDITFER